MSEKQVNQVSEHSVRVGAAQDLISLNMDLASVMQTGRCRLTRTVRERGDRRAQWGGADSETPGAQLMSKFPARRMFKAPEAGRLTSKQLALYGSPTQKWAEKN